MKLHTKIFIGMLSGIILGLIVKQLNLPEEQLSLITAWVEPALINAAPESNFQFEREGYFVADRYDHTPEAPVFNLTIGLREDKGLNQD